MNDGVTWADAPTILCLCLGFYASFLGLGEYDPRWQARQVPAAPRWPERAMGLAFALLFWAATLLFAVGIGSGFGFVIILIAFAGFWFPLLPVLFATSTLPDFSGRPFWTPAYFYVLLIALSLVGALACEVAFR